MAIKIPRDHNFLTAEARNRFIWEGEAAGSLNHPNLVSVYVADEDQGIPFIASEYCEGPTLATVLARPKCEISATVSAQLIHDLARAVQHAHSRGILHRDIKPGNVLLKVDANGSVRCKNGETFTPKLADFGLAKSLITDGETNSPDNTLTGILLGTPPYMAPEQLCGIKRNIDVRTDIFSLGVILYELLTGRRPYAGKSAVEIIKSMDGTEPPSLACQGESIPRDLETICLKCISQDPQQRYAGAAQLVDDLDRFLTGNPILARPQGRIEKAVRYIRKRPAIALLTLIAGLAPFLIIAALIWHNGQLEVAVERAERSEAITSQHLYSANIRLAGQAWFNSQVSVFRQLINRNHAHLATTLAAGDLHGLEWDFLTSLDATIDKEQVWRAHAGGVCCVCFSPNGTRLATSGTDGLIKLWDANTQQLLLTLNGHVGDVNKLAFSAQGDMLASAGDDGTVRLWNATTGKPQHVLRGHSGRVFEVVFRPKWDQVVSAGDGEGIRFWSCQTGEMLKMMPGNNVRALAMHPSVPYIAAAEHNQKLHVTQFNKARRLFETQTGRLAAVEDLAFSHDGGFLLVSSRDGDARVVDPTSGSVVSILQGHREAIQSAKYSPDDQWIATADRDGIVMLWSAAGTPVKTFRGHTDQVWTLDFSPNDSILATGDRSGNVRLWNWQERHANNLKPFDKELGFSSPSMAIFLPDAQRVLTTCPDGAFQILNLKSGKFEKTIGATSEQTTITALALSPAGPHVITGGDDGHLCFWDVNSGDLERHIQAHPEAVWDVSYSYDGRQVATCSEDHTVKLWDARSGKFIAQLIGHDKSVVVAEFSPNSPTLATAGADHNVIIWDANTHQKKFVLQGHQDAVCAVKFSPDGTILASAGHDCLIILWDMQTGQQLRTLQGHAGHVKCVAFSSNGKTLCSGDDSGSFKFWQTSTGSEFLDCQHADSDIRCIAVTPNDDAFVVTSLNKTNGKASLYMWMKTPGKSE